MQQQHWLRQRRTERVCPLQTKKRHCSRRQMRCPYPYSYVTSNIFFAATLAFALTHTTAQGRHASPHGLADTPPQGWTSWNTAGCRHLSQTFIETIMVCAVKHQCPPRHPTPFLIFTCTLPCTNLLVLIYALYFVTPRPRFNRLQSPDHRCLICKQISDVFFFFLEKTNFSAVHSRGPTHPTRILWPCTIRHAYACTLKPCSRFR